jgi:hypothetical protein
MKKLLILICLTLSSIAFSQGDNDRYYELFYIKKVQFGDDLIKERTIEFDPGQEFLEAEGIHKIDTIASLSYISRQVIDSLNQIRVGLGLKEIVNYESDEDEYGYTEDALFDFCEKKQTPLMVKDVNYNIDSCYCYRDIVSEISAHKDIMRKVLSKRNKELFVCVITDKETGNYYIYIQVRKLFTFNYFIN